MNIINRIEQNFFKTTVVKAKKAITENPKKAAGYTIAGSIIASESIIAAKTNKNNKALKNELWRYNGL